MTRDTDGKPARLTILKPLGPLVVRLAALLKWRRGDGQAGVADDPDDDPDSTGATARKRRVFAALAALLVVVGLWLLSHGWPGAGRGTAQSSSTSMPGPAGNRPAVLGETAPPMPGSYHILLTRSVFAQNGAPGQTADGAAPASDKPTLKGVSQEDAQYTAFVEAGGHIMQLRVGDALADRSIRRITLHAIEYMAQGRMTRVEVGQPLDAGEIVSLGSPASEPVEAPSPPSGPATHPAQPSDHLPEAPLLAGEPPR